MPVGPRKSISARPSLEAVGRTGSPRRRATTVGSVASRSTCGRSGGSLRPGRPGTLAAAAPAPTSSQLHRRRARGCARRRRSHRWRARCLGAADRVVEGEVVVAAGRRLGELHVVDDLPHAGLAQPVDHLRVQRAPERPVSCRSRARPRRSRRPPARTGCCRGSWKRMSSVDCSTRSTGVSATEHDDQRDAPAARTCGRLTACGGRSGARRRAGRSACPSRGAHHDGAFKTLVSVPPHGSSVSQRVPRTVATLSRPCVWKARRCPCPRRAASSSSLAGIVAALARQSRGPRRGTGSCRSPRVWPT